MTMNADPPGPCAESADAQPYALRERRTPPLAVGVMLRAARERAGLGVRETGRRAGITHTHVIGLERGARCPSVVVAEVLAVVLDLDSVEQAQLASAAVDDAGRSHPRRRALP